MGFDNLEFGCTESHSVVCGIVVAIQTKNYGFGTVCLAKGSNLLGRIMNMVLYSLPYCALIYMHKHIITLHSDTSFNKLSSN